jgi:hypothetical protein
MRARYPTRETVELSSRRNLPWLDRERLEKQSRDDAEFALSSKCRSV